MADSAKNSVYAAVLAAGSASRFGSTKQLVERDGVPLVRRAVDAATGACDCRTALVLGHDWERVSDACMPFDGFLIVNERYADGVGSSIACAARSLRHAAGAIIVVLADQPLVTAAHLRALQATWCGTDGRIVATAFAGTAGPPVLFPRACFDDLAKLGGDAGARALLEDARFTVVMVPFEPAALDIDTPGDLERL